MRKYFKIIVKAIEQLHKFDCISSDIKRRNFAPGQRCNKQSKIISLFDFGLSRRYIDKVSSRVMKGDECRNASL
ncbi:unnamed protein product [Angiostrongylus costaricensis]|uniref:Protein kinase domain-containing protein n=1 Tax=Angiostrongylus costaricensis TaxID=334426 RepID=A0A3P7K4J5_ANGCS|nr:unnamed protein product [Angiostrongylus costaricensis]